MASRSLGTLTVDLIAKIGGFVQGMSEAERAADKKTREIAKKTKQRAKEISDTWDGIGKALGATLAGISFGAAFQKVISETRNAEQEQSLLAAALKATGNQAGYSQERLNEMASAIEAVTTESAGELNQAQTVLLGFGNIVGEQLPKALMAAADYSTRTGADMKSAAEVMGRALDIPSAGMASLVKQGFKFSESQIEAAKKLEQTGRIAEAQQIVFDALNETYGGAAIAARETFGGAIDALRNTINGLLTGDTGSLKQARASIEDLNATLSNEETRQAFQTYVGWMTDLTNKVVSTAAVMANSGFFGWFLVSNKEADDLTTTYNEISSKLIKLKKRREELKPDGSVAKWWNDFSLGDVGDLDRQIAIQEKKLKGVQARLNLAIPPVPMQLGPAITPDMTPRSPGAVNLKDLEGARQAATLAKQQEAQAKSYLKQLTEQLDKTQKLSAYEKLMEDVKRGTVVLTGEQLDKARGLATIIDMTKEMEKQRTENLARQNLLFETQERLLSRQQQYQLELATYGMGDRSAAEMQERIQLIQQQQAELRKLGADQANAIAGADDSDDLERIQAIYADRLAIIRNAQSQELSMFDDLLQQRRQKELDWVSGARSAFGTYVENAQNLYQQTNQVVGNMLGGMEDALVEFAKTGKLSFRDFATSVLSDLARIQARKAIVGLFGGSGGIFSSVGSFLGFADGGYTGHGGRMEPAGIVHRGEVVWSQQDVARAGGVGVVESMRRGLNGYASGGAVGLPNVVTSGAMASTSVGVTVNVPVSVTSAGGGGQASEGALAAMGASLSKALTPMVQEIISREQRPGGRLWSWANGRS
jgi:lambda family phage tail tape measure protein